MASDNRLGEERTTAAGIAEQRAVAAADQAAAAEDQRAATLDQALCNDEQEAADREQRAADLDQRAADRDQAEIARFALREPENAVWQESRRVRSHTATERDIAAETRRRSAAARQAVAAERDARADARDANAGRRDALAAALDAGPESPGASTGVRRRRSSGSDQQARSDRAHAAGGSEHAADLRRAAALDRAQAGRERAAAAEVRRAAQAEIEGRDHLTGALRRRLGVAMLQRELDRTERTREALTVAFVDVDGLQRVNEAHGPAAGDALLRRVAEAVTRVLRPYDSVMRYGADEFVCVLSGQNLPGLEARFAQVAADIRAQPPGAAISVGLAQAGPDESPDRLIARAAQAMVASRERRPRGGRAGVRTV